MCTKVKFSAKAEAMERAEQVWADNGGAKQRVYYCRECFDWHLSSHKKKKKRRR